MRPKGSRDAGRAAAKGAQAQDADEDAAFDRLRRELVHDARAKVGSLDISCHRQNPNSGSHNVVFWLAPHATQAATLLCTLLRVQHSLIRLLIVQQGGPGQCG